MGTPKKLYPLGKYRLRAPKDAEKDTAYPVELEYTWNRQIIRKSYSVILSQYVYPSLHECKAAGTCTRVFSLNLYSLTLPFFFISY